MEKRKGSGTCSAQQCAHRFGAGTEESPRRLGAAVVVLSVVRSCLPECLSARVCKQPSH